MEDAIREKTYPVLIYGPPGTGKSCAMACLYRSFYHRRAEPKWLRLEDFITNVNRCRTSRDGRVEISQRDGSPSFFRTESQLFWIVATTPALFLDDAGLKSATDSGREIIHKLFSQRDSTQPTFISTNLSPEELIEAYDSRIVSRMCAGKVIGLDGDDRRMADSQWVNVA